MDENFLTIGMMSGTSLDGIDVAALYTDGKNSIRFGAHKTVAYAQKDRDLLFAALEAAKNWAAGSYMPDIIARAETHLTQCHGEVLNLFLQENQIDAAQVYAIGFHGQTVLHDPDAGRTVQIGKGAMLAQMTGIDVVCDFRTADVAAGGQGAPLAPLYHAALSVTTEIEKPCAVLNVGGVANITFLGRDGAVMGFDTGPGNALLDDWVRAKTAHAYDKNGVLALSGAVDPDKLRALLDNPYFERKPPKSLDRHSFSPAMIQTLSPADGAATLTALTALAVACAIPHLPEIPQSWIICGGGRHNPALLDALSAAVGQPVQVAENAGLPGDELEAQAFAWLAVRSRLGLPLTLPETTGCATPTLGGKLFKKT